MPNCLAKKIYRSPRNRESFEAQIDQHSYTDKERADVQWRNN